MGIKFAPCYANLVLAYLEEELCKISKDKYVNEFSEYIKDNFVRYLDDCFIIWNKHLNIDRFNEMLNDLHKDLKFTMENHSSEIAFLDIKVLLDNGVITTDVYYKPTDTHQFLPFKSCHPRHTKNNIPYSQAIRQCTIIDDHIVKEERFAEMKEYFLACGYPKTLIENGIKQAKSIPQQELRKTKPRTKADIVTFVSTHNPTTLICGH